MRPAKAALERMTVGMAIELAPFNIAVNTPAPVEAVASEGPTSLASSMRWRIWSRSRPWAEAALVLSSHPAKHTRAGWQLKVPDLDARTGHAHGETSWTAGKRWSDYASDSHSGRDGMTGSRLSWWWRHRRATPTARRQADSGGDRRPRRRPCRGSIASATLPRAGAPRQACDISDEAGM